MFRSQGQPHHDMITKWRLNTRAVIRDGNLGRGSDILQGKDVILEVFSKGTAATGWEEIETRRTDENGVSSYIQIVCVERCLCLGLLVAYTPHSNC